MCRCPSRALREEPLPPGRQQDQRNSAGRCPVPPQNSLSGAFLCSNPGVLTLIQADMHILHLQTPFSTNPPVTQPPSAHSSLYDTPTSTKPQVLRPESFCSPTDSFCCSCSQHGEEPRVPEREPAASHETRRAPDAVSTGGPPGPGPVGSCQTDAGGEDSPGP